MHKLIDNPCELRANSPFVPVLIAVVIAVLAAGCRSTHPGRDHSAVVGRDCLNPVRNADLCDRFRRKSQKLSQPLTDAPAVNHVSQESRETVSSSNDCSTEDGRFSESQTESRFSTDRHFSSEVKRFLFDLRDDARGVANWNNAAILSVALAGAVGMRQDLDGNVRNNTARHPDRWGEGSHALGKLGEPQIHLAAISLVYGMGRFRHDDQLVELSGTLLSTFALTGLSTLAVKAIANTDRPSSEWNGGQFGFPSYHAASSFGLAAVLDEYYGHKAGIPAYALAGLITWTRIDERDHDLSDVFFGAALGYVIGKSVANRRLHGDGRVRLLPFLHPTESAAGLMIDVKY